MLFCALAAAYLAGLVTQRVRMGALDAQLRQRDVEMRALKARLVEAKLIAIDRQLAREMAEVEALQAELKKELGITDHPKSRPDYSNSVRLRPSSHRPQQPPGERNPAPIDADRPHRQKGSQPPSTWRLRFWERTKGTDRERKTT